MTRSVAHRPPGRERDERDDGHDRPGDDTEAKLAGAARFVVEVLAARLSLEVPAALMVGTGPASPSPAPAPGAPRRPPGLLVAVVGQGADHRPVVVGQLAVREVAHVAVPVAAVGPEAGPPRAGQRGPALEVVVGVVAAEGAGHLAGRGVGPVLETGRPARARAAGLGWRRPGVGARRRLVAGQREAPRAPRRAGRAGGRGGPPGSGPTTRTPSPDGGGCCAHSSSGSSSRQSATSLLSHPPHPAGTSRVIRR